MKVFHQKQQQQTQPHPSTSIASVGEKGLRLINNDDEWKTLMEHLKTSGVTTNAAARIMIIEYLSKKQEGEDDETSCCSDLSSS